MNIGQLLFATAVMLLATALAVGLARTLALGSTVALLAVGVALGPHAPVPILTGHVAEMQAVGEIGVMLLLFVIGLDLQPTRLWSLRKLVFGLGTAQYVLTTLALFAFFAVFLPGGVAHWQPMLVGALALAMSSAAIPFPILQERGAMGSSEGRAVMAIDILQGFMVVPVLALIPFVEGRATPGSHALDPRAAVGVVAALVGVYALGRYVLPYALSVTARRLGASGFVLVVLAGVFFAAWWTDAVGVSMALGAFMMGVLLSTTVFADQVKAAIGPAKRLLLGIFFIAIGMAIDPAQVLELRGELLFYLPALLLIKFGVLFGLARLFRLDTRAAFLTGLLMMPFDEIGYVILASANAHGILSPRDHTIGITVISLSFVLSPLLINLGYRLASRLGGSRPPDADAPAIGGAVVVAGYGHVGHAVCILLERAGVRYVAFETDTARFQIAKREHHNVRYGDLTNADFMAGTALAGARMVVVAEADFGTTRQIVGSLRQFHPDVPVATAVQYLAQRDELSRLGARDVVALSPAGLLRFSRGLLGRLGVGAARADEVVDSLEAMDFAALRGVVEPEGPGAAAPAHAR